MAKSSFKPYANEADALQLADLTIENRTDRVSIYGSIDLTRDREGLVLTRELKRIVDLTLAELEKADLPEKIAIEKSETEKNPFA